MLVQHHQLGHGETWDPDLADAPGLHLVRAHGRQVRLRLAANRIALVVVLTGEIELESGDVSWTLRRRNGLLWREGPLRMASHAPCRWFVLCGDGDAWLPHARSSPGQPGLALFPWEGTCTHQMVRQVLQLARLRDADAETLRTTPEKNVLATLCAALEEQQAWLHAPLERCSGRTQQRRMQVLQRLLRVRNLIRRSGDSRIDLASLATSASYSPSHLLRVYREAFGETPGEYATRLRYQRAWELVSETRMQVYEITEMLGFESQSAFCRAFKTAFGTTTGEARRRLADGAATARRQATARAA
jgi:AraC family transcriptional regulator